MISYVDDFALTVASLSYRGNIRRLQELFEKLERKASRLGVSFSVAKTELIHWRTPSQRHSPKCVSPIQIKGEMFHPSNSVRWLGYWFTAALDPAAHYSRRLALAQGAFALIRRLSPPGAGLPPYLCHPLATSLIARILLSARTFLHPAWEQQPASIHSGARSRGGPQSVSQPRPPGFCRWSRASHQSPS